MDSLENIILSLIHNTTNEGQDQGFKEIKSLFKDPMINVSLCNCITQSSDSQVRRYAALLLRRRLLKARYWKKIAPEVQQGLKTNILEAYVKDSEKIVRNAIAELIGVIAKHELSVGKWPELMELLSNSIQSNNIIDREVGLYSLSVITKALGQKFKPHYKSLLSLFQNTLTDRSSIEIPYYTLKALTHMVCNIGTEELNLFQSLLPNIMVTIRLLATTDQEKAAECMEIFDELVESEVAIIAPHIKSLIELCLELAQTERYDEELRIKSINIVAYLIRLKKKRYPKMLQSNFFYKIDLAEKAVSRSKCNNVNDAAIIKQKLTQPILDVLFPLMCRPSPGDRDDEEDDEEALEKSIPSAAGQAIDIMALHLPPAKFIPLLMHHLEPALKSHLTDHKKAAYLAISVIAEGCSEFIRHKYLPNFVQVICQGIKDNDPVVRNAALYAVGQYAEYLQPDVSKYAHELLPVLFEYLQQTCLLLQQGNKNPPSLMRTFYAVEKFCEYLEDIQPYLPTLMSCLTTFLTINTENSITVKELAVEAIGSVATAAKELFIPYFPAVVDQLKLFISEKQTDATRPLQIQSIDTLSLIARSVGKEVFMPIAHDCIKYGMLLMEENDDPDLRRACYGLFSSVATVLKQDMAQYLSPIVDRILQSLKSTEGISISARCGENTTAFTLFEDGEEDEVENGDMDENIQLEDDEDDDDDDDIAGYSVENSYMEEKEGGCLALKEMCEEAGLTFVPYIEASFNEVRKLIESPSEDVRRAAIVSLAEFCFALNQAHLDTGKLEFRAALESNMNFLMPKLFSLAREDTEHIVVIACLETLQNVVSKLKQNSFYGGNLESMCSLIKDVFSNKLACQDEDTEGDEDDQEAEYDSMLMEYAGELIASLNKVVPWQQFGPYLAGLMPFLFSRTKKACTVSEKSCAVGTLADIVSSMQPGTIQPFISHLQPVFLAGMKDENEEVRSNACYGLGVLIEAAAESVYDQYPTYLQALSNMIATEEDPRAKDNICGAVARLIKTNLNLVPLNEVFPVLLKSLPIREDFEESNTVNNCFAYLYSIRSEVFFQNLPEILKLMSDSLASQKLKEETVASITNVIKSVNAEFPAEFERVVKSLPQANAEILLNVRSV